MRTASCVLCFVVSVLLCRVPATASEQDALAIEQSIQTRHMPHGTILDPVYAAPDRDEIVSYTRAGDSAIWTGYYLAAEAFRYRVTRRRDALEAVHRALDGIQRLVDVTGMDILARAIIPVTSPYANAIVQEESHNHVYRAKLEGSEYYWIGRASRDQYDGVFFGLSLAYDLVDEPQTRSGARDLVRRLTTKLVQIHWLVRMPDGSYGPILLGRPDHQLALLQIARHMDPELFSANYATAAKFAPASLLLLASDTLDAYRSYFKFNLDEINLYNLIRLEDVSWRARIYRSAYWTLERAVGQNPNPFFMLIAHSIDAPDAKRDGQAVLLLEQWLTRPRRDFAVDLRGLYSACGSTRRSCEQIPVPFRVPSDFLWQRSPYQLYGGGLGRIESAGIDYLLPYWMARYYRLIE
jgi:hypothetical protein